MIVILPDFAFEY